MLVYQRVILPPSPVLAQELLRALKHGTAEQLWRRDAVIKPNMAPCLKFFKHVLPSAPNRSCPFAKRSRDDSRCCCGLIKGFWSQDSVVMFVACQIMFCFPWRIHGAAIYGAPWIPSIYPLYVSIYTSTMDPMGLMTFRKKWRDVAQYSILLKDGESFAQYFSCHVQCP